MNNEPFQRSSASVRLGLFFFVFCCLLAAWLVWPLPRHFTTAIPTGDSRTATVPLLNYWILGWNAESLAQGLSGYWSPPVFHPHSGALGFSEPQPITLILAPIVWLTRSPAVAYNLYLLATLTLNALFGYRLLRTLDCDHPVAMLGGGITMLHPLALQNLESIQLTALWGILWTIDALIQHQRTPTTRNAFIIALAFFCISAACLHHAIFLMILLAITAPILLIRSEAWVIMLKGWCIAGCAAALLVLPICLPMYRIQQEYGFERSEPTVRLLSASARDWATPQDNALVKVRAGAPTSFPLFPGWIRVAILFLVLPHCVRHATRYSLFLIALGLSSLCLSFGLRLQLGTFNIWETLADWLPPLAGIRSPYRFAYFTQLAIILLSTLGVQHAITWSMSKTSGPDSEKRRIEWGKLVGLGALLAVACEFIPQRSPLYFPPQPRQSQPWITFLKTKLATDQSVLCLPVAASNSEAAHEQSALWMVYSQIHGHPILNGYSGFLPPDWMELRNQLRDAPFSNAVLKELNTLHVGAIVVRLDRMPESTELADLMRSPPESLVQVYRDPRYVIFQFQ